MTFVTHRMTIFAINFIMKQNRDFCLRPIETQSRRSLCDERNAIFPVHHEVIMFSHNTSIENERIRLYDAMAESRWRKRHKSTLATNITCFSTGYHEIGRSYLCFISTHLHTHRTGCTVLKSDVREIHATDWKRRLSVNSTDWSTIWFLLESSDDHHFWFWKTFLLPISAATAVAPTNFCFPQDQHSWQLQPWYEEVQTHTIFEDFLLLWDRLVLIEVHKQGRQHFEEKTQFRWSVQLKQCNTKNCK